jgi:hypothetical protein
VLEIIALVVNWQDNREGGSHLFSPQSHSTADRYTVGVSILPS